MTRKEKEKLIQPILSTYATAFRIMGNSTFPDPIKTIKTSTEWARTIVLYLLDTDIISLDEYNRLDFMATDILERAINEGRTKHDT